MTGRRASFIVLVFVGILAAVRPALAQQARPAPAPQPQTSFRPFFLFSVERFSADQTFEAGFGSSVQPLVGGGVSVTLPNHVFVDLAVSRFGKTGERGFVFEGQSFGLGIPL